MTTYVVKLPGSATDRHYTTELAPVSGDLITLDDDEQVRVIEVHTDGKGGWIVYANPVTASGAVALHGLAIDVT